MSKRDFLSTAGINRHELDDLLDLTTRIKGKRPGQVLGGKTLGMLFFQPSLRTRVSFEVGMQQLGGHCINLSADDLYELEPGEQAIMDGPAEEHVKDKIIDPLICSMNGDTCDTWQGHYFRTKGDFIRAFRSFGVMTTVYSLSLIHI